jgi:argininosuccinate lyase
MSSIARTDATGGALDPAFLAWQTSLPVDRRLLEVDVRGSIAHVEGLVAAGLLSRNEGDTLQAALASLPGKLERGETELPLEEDVHMAVEVWLRREIGELADKLHTGRSRNDQVALDLELWIREAVERLSVGLDRLEVALEAWVAQQGELPMPAYTHRQVAIPVLASLWIDAALTQPLRRDRALFALLDDELAYSPLGAGAIAGNTLPIDPRIAAAELGFVGGPRNPLDAVGSRDYAITLAFACTRMSLHLGRFSADLVELASDGLVTLGGAIACGSSMMPHKRNPDLFELVRAQAALRQGELVALMTTFHGLGTGYHRDFQQDKQLLFANVDGTLACIDMITLALGHFVLVPERCIDVLRSGDAIATDLTERLVALGVPFRVAYRKIGALVAAQRSVGKRLVDLTREDLQATELPLELLEALDVAESARRRAGKFMIQSTDQPAP